MTKNLYELGHAAARHPWRTMAVWILTVVVLGMANATWGGEPRDDWNVEGARAHQGIEQLRAHFPDAGGSWAQVVVHDPEEGRIDPLVLDHLHTRLAELDHVASVSDPRLSTSGDTALVEVRYDVPTTDPDLMGDVAPLTQAAEVASDAGYQVELGGELPGTANQTEGRGEVVGVVVALVLLIVAFGSVVAAGLPIAVAIAGLAAGSSLVGLVASRTEVSATAPTVATMVGLGVGIDYALLLVTRHVERLRAGDSPVDAAASATARAGRSVIGAGLTVLISLMGLKLAGLPMYDAFGLTTGVTVVAVMLAALTLVPALCALAGHRLLSRRTRRHGLAGATNEPLTARWARRVARRPVVWALLALVVLLGLAAPALGMRTWPQDGGSQSSDLTTRRASDLVAAAFGPGANGPLTLVVDRERLGADEIAAVHDRVAGLADVAVSTPVVESPDGRLAVWQVEPVSAPSDARTTELLSHLREGVLPQGVEATGYTAQLADISGMLAQRLWLVVGFVVALSVLVLVVMFRSVVVPLKAAAMNLLSIGAAYGVMTLVFQHGWGVTLLGLDHAVPVSSWVPILMFAVLFGLSMDYEVFLLSAVRDEWLDSGDPQGSVVRGLASTGRVISMAAAIMVAVFLGFATEDDAVVKMMGVGLAVAVGLDASVVRMVLVPASMTLLGRWNWWFPRLSRTPRPWSRQARPPHPVVEEPHPVVEEPHPVVEEPPQAASRNHR